MKHTLKLTHSTNCGGRLTLHLETVEPDGIVGETFELSASNPAMLGEVLGGEHYTLEFALGADGEAGAVPSVESAMVAKFRVASVWAPEGIEGLQNLRMEAVTDALFDQDGASDDNSFARWTPSGTLEMGITNPVLHGKIQEGEKYYLYFQKANPAPEAGE